MSAIDLSMVQELLDLCDENDLALLAELIEMFLADAPARIRAIVDGCADGDFEQVERAAHSLKGSAGNLGAVEVLNLAERLQVAGRAGDGPSVLDATRALEPAYAAAAGELRALVTRLAG
jgi:HPt (histidine-containing phosphotransfer) domain-containing protein